VAAGGTIGPRAELPREVAVADTEKRIVVEGVEYEQLVQFPKILRAVTASFWGCSWWPP
jgi:hypothetical protein